MNDWEAVWLAFGIGAALGIGGVLLGHVIGALTRYNTAPKSEGKP